MSIEYSVNVCILVDPTRHGFSQALIELEDTIGEGRCDREGDEVNVDAYTTSTSHSEEIDEALKSFASRFATEPSRVDTNDGSSESECYYIGPEGFDELECKIADAERAVQYAQEQLDALYNERIRREGTPS